MSENNNRFEIDGILSFIKGCRIFLFGETTPSSAQFSTFNTLEQSSDNPSVYTKLSCFLPWVAQQYNLNYDQQGDDPACSQGTGNITDVTSEDRVCLGNPSFGTTVQELDEKECIFPFYFDGQLVNDCIQLGKKEHLKLKLILCYIFMF